MMRINTTGYGHYRRVSEKSAQSGVGVCASECDRASEKGGREGTGQADLELRASPMQALDLGLHRGLHLVTLRS